MHVHASRLLAGLAFLVLVAALACARPAPLVLPGPDVVPETTIRAALTQGHWRLSEAEWFVATVPVRCAGRGEVPVSGFLGGPSQPYARVDCSASPPTLLLLLEHEAHHAHDHLRAGHSWPDPAVRRDLARLAEPGPDDPLVDPYTRAMARRVLRENRADDAHVNHDLLDLVGHEPRLVPRWYCRAWLTVWDPADCTPDRWRVRLPVLTR